MQCHLQNAKTPDETFWGYNDMVEATNTHEYVRRYKGMIEEDWLLIK